MPANSEKEHLSIVICGHVDSGKSATTGRLIFELGGLPERELDKFKREAARLGKGYSLSLSTWTAKKGNVNVASRLRAQLRNSTLKSGITPSLLLLATPILSKT